MRIAGSGKEKQCDTSQSKAAMSCVCDCLQLVNKNIFMISYAQTKQIIYKSEKNSKDNKFPSYNNNNNNNKCIYSRFIRNIFLKLLLDTRTLV